MTKTELIKLLVQHYKTANLLLAKLGLQAPDMAGALLGLSLRAFQELGVSPEEVKAMVDQEYGRMRSEPS